MRAQTKKGEDMGFRNSIQQREEVNDDDDDCRRIVVMKQTWRTNIPTGKYRLERRGLRK